MRGIGIIGLVGLLAGCGECEEVCTEVPLSGGSWTERAVTPEQAAATLAAATGFDAVRPLGDTDGDGISDVGVLDGGSVRVFSGALLAAGGALTPDQASRTLGSGATGMAAVGDIDGDGLADVALGNGNAWEIYTTAATPFATIPKSGGGTIVSLAGGQDIDGDGKNDVVVSQWFVDDGRDREVVSRLNLAQGGSHAADAGPLGFGAVVDLERPHSLVLLGDVDGDGRSDVAAGAARNFAAVQLASEWGEGPFGGLSSKEVHLHECWPGGDGCSSWVRVDAPGDVDGDGLADLIAMGVAPASAWLIPGSDLANDSYKTKAFSGTLAFRREITGATELVPAGDVDGILTGDGKPLMDLLATDGDRTAWLILGNQLTAQPALDVGEATHAFEGFAPDGGVLVSAAGDLNGDGTGDLLVGSGSLLHVLLVPPVEGETEYETVCEVVDERKRCRKDV